MNIEALTPIILVILLMISSSWAVQNTNGYYVLCEYALGRFIALLFILICTSINVAYGLIFLLVYMCLYVLYLLNIKFMGSKNYVEKYFNLYPNSDILSRNASSHLTSIDYRFKSNRNDNKLFHTNKDLMDLRIQNEHHHRNSLNNILYPPNHRSQKVKPTSENTETLFTPNYMQFQSLF